MKRLKIYLNEVKIIYPICGYLLLLGILLFFKIKIYNYNLSALIGIWKGFAILNPDLIETGFIVYDDGGYDGQFFYLIAKSLFTSGIDKFPMLDSFYLRFNRIGLAFLSGLISKVFGFNHYSLITLCILTFSHIYSFLLLNKMLASNNKYLAYFHLFSPITLNSNLLLVSDSLSVSFSIFCIYFILYLGVNVFAESSIECSKKKIHYVFFFLILVFTSFIKETGLILLITLFLICIYDKKIKVAIPIFLSSLFYITISQLFKYTTQVHLGTNPLSFLDLIDYPLFGFYKSIHLNSFSDIKNLFREFAKLPIFIFYILLILNLKNIKKIRDLIVFIPIFFILLIMGVGEQGYWLSFDNISRMLSLSIPWIILLKNENNAYNDYNSLYISIFILLLLTIRLIYIKSPMSFYIY